MITEKFSQIVSHVDAGIGSIPNKTHEPYLKGYVVFGVKIILGR